MSGRSPSLEPLPEHHQQQSPYDAVANHGAHSHEHNRKSVFHASGTFPEKFSGLSNALRLDSHQDSTFPSRGPSRDPEQAAARLVSELTAPQLSHVFKRELSLRSRRLADPDPSPGSSPHALSPGTVMRVNSSYAPPSSPPSVTTATQCAAQRIQRAWRRHRIITSRTFSAFGGEAMRLVQQYMHGEDLAEHAASEAHLILHFDINKTILMSDAVKGAGQADMVNMLISECAWGRMTVGPEWVAVGRLATDRPENDPQLMTYRNFLDSFLYPYVEGSAEGVLQENLRRKKLCGSLQKSFTEDGQPGAMFCGVFHALQRQLEQPEAEHTSFFPAGQRRILPSFFELLLQLQASQRCFTIVFRTFGTDLEDVIEEVNMFATGQHPSWPGVQLDGTDGKTDLRLAMPTQTGAFFRWGHRPADTMLALGVDERVLGASRVTQTLLEETATDCNGVVLRGFDEIHAAFRSLAHPGHNKAHSSGGTDIDVWIQSARRAHNCAFALRDNYHFWKSRNEFPRAGKLLLDDCQDATTLAMFFDDNIGHTSAHIADARDVRTGDSIAFAAARGAQLIRSEPVNAILDPKYFVRAVSQAELRILRNRERAATPARAQRKVVFSGPFGSGNLQTLHNTSKSGVARVSLAARHRWQAALYKVLIMGKVVRALNQSRM